MNKLTPLKSVRQFCGTDCMAGNANEVRLCTADDDIPIGACPLFDLRMGTNPKKLHIPRQIRKKCLDCSSYNEKDVRECQFNECLLYPFRMGKNINKRGSTSHLKEMQFSRQLKMPLE